MILTKVSQAFPGFETKVTLSNQNPVYLYELDGYINQDTFHCNVESEDTYQFYNLAIFNETNLLKKQYFHTISVYAEKSDNYYVLILLTDTRPDPISATVKINYGYLEDDPYWGTSGTYDDALIDGFPILSIVIILFGLSFGLGLIIRRKIKFK